MTSQPFIISADDDADDQELIQEALQAENIQVKLCKVANGQKLIDVLQELEIKKERLPDAILLDLNMPVLSGREALLQIKKQNSPFSGIPVIILSTSNALEDVSYCLKSGATLFLVKPTSFGTLKVILREALCGICTETIS